MALPKWLGAVKKIIGKITRALVSVGAQNWQKKPGQDFKKPGEK